MLSTAAEPSDRLGDPIAFEALVRPLMVPAYRLAFGMLRDRSAAEDAVQESALRAWRHRRTFRPGSELKPWFFAIVANQCRSAQQRPWWHVLRRPEIEHHGEPAPDGERVIDVRRALRRMGHAERLVVVLRFYLDLDYSEIAQALGISEQAARSRTQRAIRRLRSKLAEEPSR